MPALKAGVPALLSQRPGKQQSLNKDAAMPQSQKWSAVRVRDFGAFHQQPEAQRERERELPGRVTLAHFESSCFTERPHLLQQYNGPARAKGL